MKKILIVLLALFAFGALKATLVKYQIHDSGMVVANAESGAVDPTGPPSENS